MNNFDDKKFIYVFNEADMRVMLELGFELMMQDAQKQIYVFLADNGNRKNFALMPNITYCFSNTLTF